MSRPPVDVSMLDMKFFCSDLGKLYTVRDYLQKLLATLWAEEEGFSGKRPFGNGAWKHDLYTALIVHKHVDGHLDADGCIENIDLPKAERIVQALIQLMCEKRK